MSEFTYPEVGATRDGRLPAGYHHLRYRRYVADREAFGAAAEAVLTWRVHRAAGMRMDASAERAGPGVHVTTGLGVGPLRLSAPCEVVWSVDEPDEAGFAYGTLSGHPERGEESFLVTRDGKGRVWFTVTSFSRADRWFTRLAGPGTVAFQQLYARRLAATLRNLAAGRPR
ncbi:DUF1990 family protein [Rhizomonospora bruguierae]|uniref:DUF1990 family protein n=1 Tax=Rhizomonospora bruguierae TaxID=1581705 RepID=UPI0020BD66E1|nr:DUF1990 domain-containing protein [Micromonospora sp. NBRC 107566]